MTPAMVHYGKAEQVSNQRQVVLASAFDTHPERFVRGMPISPSLPQAAWINKPKVESMTVVVADNQTIPEVSGNVAIGGCRSLDNIEIECLRLAVQLSGNDTKFESEVAQRR